MHSMLEWRSKHAATAGATREVLPSSLASLAQTNSSSEVFGAARGDNSAPRQLRLHTLPKGKGGKPTLEEYLWKTRARKIGVGDSWRPLTEGRHVSSSERRDRGPHRQGGACRCDTAGYTVHEWQRGGGQSHTAECTVYEWRGGGGQREGWGTSELSGCHWNVHQAHSSTEWYRLYRARYSPSGMPISSS